MMLPQLVRTEWCYRDWETVEPQSETVSKFSQAMDMYNAIADAEGSAKKRRLSEERRKFMDENAHQKKSLIF